MKRRELCKCLPPIRRYPRPTFWVLPGAFLAVQTVLAQQVEWNFSMIVRGNYTTSSKLFENPDASTVDLRNEYTPIDRMMGWGGEIRYSIADLNLFIAMSVDFNSKSTENLSLFQFEGATRRVPMTEGIRFIPLELSVNSYIPLSSETFQLSMGGGIGLYYAERTLSVAGVSASVTNKPYSIGINVGIGMEYKLVPGISIQGSMKFRDPEIDNESTFNQDRVDYQGTTNFFRTDPLKTKINIDGMTLSLGILLELM